jgi:2-dehydropantoate 2-reductase
VCVYGAGSVGCYVGGRLAAAGADVVLVGRDRVGQQIAGGMRLTDLHGADLHVSQVPFSPEPAAAAGADLVLVTVKSGATGQVGSELATVLGPEAMVVSFQNGVSNTSVLRRQLTQQVLAGMVPFNVVQRGGGAYHQASDGFLDVERSTALTPYVEQFAAAGLPLTQHDDMPAVMWAKLLLNLNNAVNALSGLPLKEELSHRDYRRCAGLAQREALAVGASGGMRAARLTPLPAALLPRVLALPDAMFSRVAGGLLEIDPLARSSMLDDLETGRATEVDWINGEVVRLARGQGGTAPVNACLVELVHAAERGGRRDWPAAALFAALRSAH